MNDQQVNARLVLASINQLKREGTTHVMETLEQVEPDLLGHALETLSLIDKGLQDLHAPYKKSKRLLLQIEELVLVIIMSLRRGHYELWREANENGPMGKLDPAPGDQPADKPPSS